MRTKRWITLASAAFLALAEGTVATGAPIESGNGPDSIATGSTQTVESVPHMSGVLLASTQRLIDPCFQAEVVSSPSRPNWDSGAATTQCGVLETDFGWLFQPMGGGVQQRALVSSVRYGLTPKLDLRWGTTNHISQRGGGPTLEGIGDQSVSATYRFQDQSRWIPALAFSYGLKIPTANPTKGFGTGFIDHQFLLIVSRDLGRNHIDFNTVGTLTGKARGHGGSPQFGLAFTRQVTGKVAWIFESYGGPQEDTSDRFGAILSGVSYSLHPWLVLDGAYVKTYTAGCPREQILFGLTYAMRAGFPPLARGSKIARLLGR